MENQKSTQLKKNERILVIQTAFLGDIVLLTSFLKKLREIHPQADIALLTTQIGKEILTPNSWSIQLLSYDKRGKESGVAGFLRKAKELRSFHPTLVFCLHRSLRSSLLAKLSGSGKIYGFSEAVGAVFYTKKISRKIYEYEAEKNYALLSLEPGGVARSEELFPELSFTKNDEKEAAELLGNIAEKKFIAISPSSVWATKRWPAKYFAEAANAIWKEYSLVPVFIGANTKEDLECAELASEKFQEFSGIKPLNLTGKTKLGVLKAVLSKARIALANDSAPLHMAIAVRTPVVAIFGPTTKSLGFFPLAPEGKSLVAELKNLSCRPCGLHGHKVCPQKHFRCMLDLSPSEVIEKLNSILREN